MEKEKTIKRIKYVGSGSEYEQGESGKWKCHVCGEFSLDEPDGWDYCPICDAPNNDAYVSGNPMETHIKLDEAQRQWREKRKIDWEWSRGNKEG